MKLKADPGVGSFGAQWRYSRGWDRLAHYRAVLIVAVPDEAPTLLREELRERCDG